ncbi:hypothetical protein H4R33_002784 [Dimargaris cristalligena]|nr:hypothetical protein H4R33_002784 [Dimargaris cristalligena]
MAEPSEGLDPATVNYEFDLLYSHLIGDEPPESPHSTMGASSRAPPPLASSSEDPSGSCKRSLEDVTTWFLASPAEAYPALGSSSSSSSSHHDNSNNHNNKRPRYASPGSGTLCRTCRPALSRYSRYRGHLPPRRFIARGNPPLATAANSAHGSTTQSDTSSSFGADLVRTTKCIIYRPLQFRCILDNYDPRIDLDYLWEYRLAHVNVPPLSASSQPGQPFLARNLRVYNPKPCTNLFEP